MRSKLSVLAILVFIALYLVVCLQLADPIARLPGLVVALCWAVAGLLWVLPVRWLMLWGAGKR